MKLEGMHHITMITRWAPLRASASSRPTRALGLAGERPTPAGVLAFSGFIPTVEGWQADLASRPDVPVFIAHGRRDPIMNVDFARRADALLQAGGVPVEYHESDAAHHIDPAHIPAAVRWLADTTAEHRSPTTSTQGR
jgi:phospholipase/carboxylesterase